MRFPARLIRRLMSASAVLQAAALIALCPAVSVFLFAQAAAPTAVKFALDARAEGPEALLLLPEEKQYFKAEGLDLELSKMPPPLDPLARLASGASDIGFADLTDLIRYRDHNHAAPLKAVFIVYNKPPHAVV